MTSTTNARAPWNVRGSNPRIPPGDRRTPLVVVDLMIGDVWGVTASLHAQRKRGLIMRLPVGADGGEGMRPAPELLALMEQAAMDAVRADPVAMAHLLQKRTGRRSKPQEAAA